MSDGIRADQVGLELMHDSSGLVVRKDGTKLSTSATGNVHAKAAGSVTGVFMNTTFDGSIGSTGYTVGDIVVALKAAGFLAP